MIKKSIMVIAIASLAFLPVYHFYFCTGEIYSFKGAYLQYSVTGPENYTIFYEILKIDGNGMRVLMAIHYSNGTWQNETFKDSVEHPKYIPVVPSEEIGSKNLTFMNYTFTLEGKKKLWWDGKEHAALEYTYVAINKGITIFVDLQTGIILRAINYYFTQTWHIELKDTNIKERNCIAEYILLGIFAVSGVLSMYYYIRKRA